MRNDKCGGVPKWTNIRYALVILNKYYYVAHTADSKKKVKVFGIKQKLHSLRQK